MGLALELAALLLGTLILDRILLLAESRGWIHYRHSKPIRGVSMYHLNELSQALNGEPIPTIVEEVSEDESGDPPDLEAI